MLGSGLKASKSKLIKTKVVFKRARSLVLTNSWPQEAGNMILGLGGHVGIWAAQALPLLTAFPPFHPCSKSRPVGHVLKRIRILDIYVQSSDFNVSS